VLDTLPVVAELNDDLTGRGGTDSITYGRAAPGATYVWPFPTGTRAPVSGRVNDDLRLRLAPGLDAWVSAADAHPLPPGTPAPRATVGSLTLTPAPTLGRTTVRLPVGQRLPFQVEERDDGLRLRLYGAVGDLNWIRYGPVAQDSLVRRLEWRQEPGDQVVLDISLAAPLWGYRARWSQNDLLLEIRRPPPIDLAHPLKDRLIVVDPGHPPAGATGPTGLAERDANLAVALRLRDLLRNAGARVIMTREQDTPVDLWSRVKLADSVDADLLVSIHNNALPDGVNPFTNNGTSVFYNHPRSLPLARAIQTALVRELGLRDLGVARADLALARPAWMPAVLCEGLFMILPDQEHALRTPEGQEAYAKGVEEGIESYLRDVAAQLAGQQGAK
jgi:N-acetylmuramoyl-L-alanine amidase